VSSWDPFHDLITIQDRMNKLFETVLTGPSTVGTVDEIGTWSPTVRVTEGAEVLRVECELAGLGLESVEVQVREGRLVVQGSRERRDSGDEWTWHRVERSYGKFKREITIPDGDLDLEGVRARLEAGVLVVDLPKLPESRPRNVPISRGSSLDH
jgi:HSP20 family protein